MNIDYKFITAESVEYDTVEVADDANHQTKVSAVLQKIANATGERIYVAMNSVALPTIRMGTNFFDPEDSDLDDADIAPVCAVERVSICEDGKTWVDLDVNPDR